MLYFFLMNLVFFFLQGAQCTWSPSALHQNITTAAESSPQGEHWASRTAPLGQDLHTDSDRYALFIVGIY